MGREVYTIFSGVPGHCTVMYVNGAGKSKILAQCRASCSNKGHILPKTLPNLVGLLLLKRSEKAKLLQRMEEEAPYLVPEQS